VADPERVNRRIATVRVAVVALSALVVVALGLASASPDLDQLAGRVAAAPDATSAAATSTDRSADVARSRPLTQLPGTRVTTVETVGPSSPRRSAPSATSTTDPADPTTEPTAPPQDPDAPAVVARPVPGPTPAEAPPAAAAPPWAVTTVTTGAGYVSTEVGCTALSPPGGAALDAFFGDRVGPVIGWDYQHVYDLGGGRYLWLFQDAFIDHSGAATSLSQASFAHNVAMVQEGSCFRLLHRGSAGAPAPFEPGTGSVTLSTWFWPMGGELHDGLLQVFWARMVKDPYDPPVPDGLGWHPADTWVATYDPSTLARLDFRPAANASVTPIYGYAVASDATHTYLFGNTFEQNLAREGGYWARQHSAAAVYLARVPRGRLQDAPEYRTADGWSGSPADARPILQRHWAEFPLQPRFIDGQWVAAAAVDGYWGDRFSVDVARQPWGPWTTVHSGGLVPRSADPKMNTYHAHLAPWRDGLGNLVVTVSNNARDMRRDAWPHPYRYRPMAFQVPWVAAPADPPTTTSAPSVPTPSTSTALPTTSRPTSPPSSTSTTTTSTVPPASTTTSTSSTTTSLPPPSTSTTATGEPSDEPPEASQPP